MADSHDQRSSLLEAAPKFPKCSHFQRRGDNHERCQQCRFIEGGHECTRQSLAESVNHVCLRIGTLTKRPSLRSSRGKPPRTPKSWKMQWMTASRSMHQRRFWDWRKRRVGSRTRRLVTSRSPSPTSQPRTNVPMGCSLKWSNCRSSKSNGTSRTETGTDCHHHRSRDEDRRRDRYSSNRGSPRHIATAMIIAIQHCPQDDPVTEAGSGVQRPERQLLPVLVTVIQRVSRGLHGGLVLRTEHIVQWPSRQPHSCEGARPPAVLICLVIRDRHSRCMTWVVDVVQQIFRPGLGSIHFFQFNSIPIQVGFRIFQFNFNSNRIQNLSIQFQFN